MTADLADPAGIDTLVAAIAGRPVDLLVNNASVATYGAHADLDPRAEAGVIAVNCTAQVALTRAVLPGMLERRHGFVLNTASTIAFQPAPGQAAWPWPGGSSRSTTAESAAPPAPPRLRSSR